MVYSVLGGHAILQYTRSHITQYLHMAPKIFRALEGSKFLCDVRKLTSQWHEEQRIPGPFKQPTLKECMEGMATSSLVDKKDFAMKNSSSEPAQIVQSGTQDDVSKLSLTMLDVCSSENDMASKILPAQKGSSFLCKLPTDTRKRKTKQPISGQSNQLALAKFVKRWMENSSLKAEQIVQSGKQVDGNEVSLKTLDVSLPGINKNLDGVSGA